MNDIVEKKQTGVAGLASIAAGLKTVKRQMPSFGGKAYLKFGKDGQWSLGRSQDDLTGRVIVFNIETLRSGYVCWTNYPDVPGERRKKNEKMGEEMLNITQGAIDPAELPDLGWEWRQQQAIDGRLVDGDKAEVTFNTSSLGGLEAMAVVIDATLERVAQETTYIYPRVRLSSDFYMHNEWGKTYKPIFEIVGWTNVEGDPAGSDDVSEAKADTESEVEDREAPDDVETDEAPVRRRRRRAS